MLKDMSEERKKELVDLVYEARLGERKEQKLAKDQLELHIQAQNVLFDVKVTKEELAKLCHLSLEFISELEPINKRINRERLTKLENRYIFFNDPSEVANLWIKEMKNEQLEALLDKVFKIRGEECAKNSKFYNQVVVGCVNVYDMLVDMFDNETFVLICMDYLTRIFLYIHSYNVEIMDPNQWRQEALQEVIERRKKQKENKETDSFQEKNMIN